MTKCGVETPRNSDFGTSLDKKSLCCKTEQYLVVRLGMKRYFEYVGADTSRASGQAEKFWEVSITKTELTIRFGKIGANGQTVLKTFPDANTAEREAEKLIAEKIKKGYIETSIGAKSTSATGAAKSKLNAEITACIACSEEIMATAKLCKHCGTMQSDPRFLGSALDAVD